MVEKTSTEDPSQLEDDCPITLNFYEDEDAERLQCVDEDSINFLISSAVADRSRHYKPDSAETEAVRQQIIELSEKGYGPVAISRILGISRQRASRWIRRHEAEEVSKEARNDVIQKPTQAQTLSKREEEGASPLLAANSLSSSCVEQLQCIDQQSIEALTSLFTSEAPQTRLNELTHDSITRSQIIDLHKEGHGPTAIARELGITRQTAARWVKRYIEEGSLKTKMRVGRPRKLTPEQKVLIQQYVTEKPYVTITEVKKKFRLSCSRSTVWGIMKNPSQINPNSSHMQPS